MDRSRQPATFPEYAVWALLVFASILPITFGLLPTDPSALSFLIGIPLLAPVALISALAFLILIGALARRAYLGAPVLAGWIGACSLLGSTILSLAIPRLAFVVSTAAAVYALAKLARSVATLPSR